MAKNRKRKKKANKVLFFIELIILAVLIGGLFLYAQINKKLDATQDSDFDISKVGMNEEVVGSQVTKGYQMIALVGLDSRDGSITRSNSDTMIVACINNDTKEVRLLSVYRDTYLRVREDEDGNGIYNKANNAYAVDGAEGMLTMLNNNLDLTISDYVAVDFDAVAEVVDLLGGIEVTLNHDEIVFMNDYCIETSKVTGKDYDPIDPDDEGTHLLNGVQAVSYSRIRYTAGNDFKRAQRQRLVLQKMVEKVKTAGLGTLNDIMDTVFPMVRTSFSKSQIIKMATSMLSYNIGETTGFPFIHFEDDIGDLDCVIPVTLEQNVKELHAWMFGEESYNVSSAVKAYSDRIADKSGYGEEYIERARAASERALPAANSEADTM